jgi:hypothetical protein
MIARSRSSVRTALSVLMSGSTSRNSSPP